MKIQHSKELEIPRKLIPLGEIADIKGGFAFKSSDFCKDGFPVVKIQNIEPPNVNLDSCEKIAPDKVVGLDEYRLNCRDIVMAMTGATIGKVGRIRSNTSVYLNQRVAKISSKYGKEKEYDDFIYAVVSQNGFEQEVLNNATGSAQANVSADGIGRILIPDFLPEEQIGIGKMISSVDDKIELNRKMNETLEAIARTIFKSWFVDFDPVHAKAEGKDTGLPKEIANLFPDSFENSELGEIPKGWRVLPLPKVFEINPSRQLTKGKSAPYLDMQNMPTRGHRLHDLVIRSFGSGMRFINGDTLMARITPCLENGKTAFVDFLKEGEVGWGSTEYIVFRPRSPLPLEFGYYLARSEDFRLFAISNMSGTSGRQRTPADSFTHYSLVVPPADIAFKFGFIVKQIMLEIKSNDEQVHTLAAIRDTLLPKLMSGEIRIGAIV